MDSSKMSMASKKSTTSLGNSRSVGGRSVNKLESMSSIANQKVYTKDGRVKDDTNAETKIRIAMKAKAARRAEVVGVNKTKSGAKQMKKKSMRIPRIEKNADSYALIKTALERNILFNDCTQEQLDAIIYAMKPKKIANKVTLITEGDEGYNFYVIQTGRFEFTKGGVKIGEANGGDSFGELALLYFAPRATTVTSLTPAEVWKLDRVTFRKILDSSNEQKENRIREALKNTPLFEDFSNDQIEKLVDIVHFQSFKGGDVIIRKGDSAQFFYIIASGRVQVTKAGDVEDLNDTIFGPGDYFGEQALLTNETRNANVIAIEDCDLLVLDKENFDLYLGSLVQVLDHNLGMRVLQSVDLLCELEKEMFDELCDELRPEYYKKGEEIIREGDAGKKFYIVKSGKVDVVKTQEGDEKSVVAVLGTGGYFGEFALLNDEPRAASVFAQTDVQLFSLDRDNFERLFGPLESMEKKVELRKSELRKSEMARKSQTSFTMKPEEVKRSNIKFEDLKMLSILGTGTFGVVKLVQHSVTGNTYALKILQKHQIVQYKQQANVMNEKKVMMQSDHPFILRLYETFRDKNCLYMLLELVQGGELFTLLHVQTSGRLSNQHSRFYAACVLDALEYLHNKHIVYRDLKPENLMIDTQGYIKVVDFGFAKIVKQKTYTLCGTPEYLAPELVLQKGHNKAVDYWAIGVLIFEMLNGVSPFADTKRNEQITICRNIVRLKFDFPRKFPAAAKNLVQRLLKKYPHERIGMTRQGTQEIKEHKWFSELKWDKLFNKELSAPWLPTVTNNLDISNFEPYEEDNPVPEYEDDGTNWDVNF